MRREHLYLQDILEACGMIQTFLAGIDASTFLVSELHKGRHPPEADGDW